jgi:hypothetical protein
MNDTPVEKHRQEMHDAFFQDRDQELLDFLQFEAETLEEHERNQFQAIAGTSNLEVLNALKQVGITSTSMTAFMLLPLVRLAWADARIENGEIDSILKAATDDGIVYGAPAYWLLNRWLTEKPTEQMLDAWWKYAQALARELNETSLEVFRQATLGRAQRVAEASGGMLGMGAKISENERLVLHDLAHALTKPSSL